MNYGTVRIRTPDGQVRDYTLETPAVRIGRSPDNNIVVAHPSVSERHVRVSIDSGVCFIEDLGSESGTFVDGVRLAAGERQIFGPTPVRLGDVDAQFFVAEERGSGQTVSTTPQPIMTERQPLVVTVTGPAAAVAPGGTGTASVAIQNRGATVDEITVSVVDLPPGWASIATPLLTLLPGARGEVAIALSPPRGIEARAGDHPFRVVVRSGVHGSEAGGMAVLSVSEVAGFSLAVQPVRSSRDFKLTLENTGNAPAGLSLAAQDDEGKLRFDFETMNVDLGPGERRTVGLRVKLPGAPRLGPEVIKAFRVEAAARELGAKQTASGQLRIKPKLEPWRLPAIALVVLAALSGGGAVYASRCEDWSLPGCGKAAATPDGGTPTPNAGTATPGGANGTPTPPATQTTATAAPTTPSTSPTKPPPGSLRFPKADIVLDPKKDYFAIVTTSAGEFILDLDVANAYNTSNSFAFLAEKGFYEGLKFKPQGTWVEHGDPVGDGTGTAGYVQDVELPKVLNTKGTVGMTRLLSDPGVVGSQWYVNIEDNSRFDTARIRGNPRPVFGTVIRGLEVAAKLTDKDTIEHIEIREK